MQQEELKRIDTDPKVREKLLPLCRLSPGEVWTDPEHGHRIGVLDACSGTIADTLMKDNRAALAVHDPPYNIKVGKSATQALSQHEVTDYIEFTKKWVRNSLASMSADAHLYIWLGADVRNHFQPLPEVMVLMREFKELSPRNFITLRNQRGYGTPKNWMWVRQELLHYTKGTPHFKVTYTDIPKILKGYYKTVGGKRTENWERGKSDTIRPGNVWIDIQQVFYRMKENVPGCYAQKPLKAIERIIKTSSIKGDSIIDFFSHSGTTLIAGERLERKVYTIDSDPIYAEITRRRLEHYRSTGNPGWQWHMPFPELAE